MRLGISKKWWIYPCYLSCCWLSVTGFAGVSRQEAQQWCLAHAFELVELSPEELPDEDGETHEICTLCVRMQYAVCIYKYVLP